MVGRGGSSLEAHEVIAGGGAIVPRGTRVAVDVCRVGDDGATENDDGEVLELADVLELQWVAHTQQRQFPLSRSHASTHAGGRSRSSCRAGARPARPRRCTQPDTDNGTYAMLWAIRCWRRARGPGAQPHSPCLLCYIRRAPAFRIPYCLFLFLLPFAPTRLSFASKSPFKMADLLSHVSTPSSGWRVNPPVSDIFTRMLIC